MKRAVIAVALLCAATSTWAQDPRRGSRGGEDECPQGRELRARGNFPATMTDCQVLDADTDARNRRLRQQAQPKPKPPPAAQVVAPIAAPKPPPAAHEPSQAETAPKPVAPPSEPVQVEIKPVDYGRRVVGNWVTSAKRDRFGDGGVYTATAVSSGSSMGLVVRCIQKELSIGILNGGSDPKPLKEGEQFDLKFRVDTQPVVEAKGEVINPRLIQVETEISLVKSMREGKETAIRLEDQRGVAATYIFKTSGAVWAFVDLSKDCPLD